MTAPTTTIPPRFCGPPTSGNGGYTAGVLATVLGCSLGDAAEVRLHVMPPLDTPLTSSVEDGVTRLVDGDTVVVSGRTVPWPIAEGPQQRRPASWDEAVAAAAQPWDDSHHPFPTCFVCGPHRAEHDGLRLFARPVAGRAHDQAVYASPWVPDSSLSDPDDPTTVAPPIVWAALDCPGGQALHVFGEGTETAVLLGTFTARRLGPVLVGSRYVLTSWERAPSEGRKHYSATVLTDAATGDVIGESTAVWIAVPRN